MHTKPVSPWKQALLLGLLGGAISVLLSLVGMVAAFGERYIVSGWFTMGQVLFLAPILFLSYTSVRRVTPQPSWILLLCGLLSGLVGSALLAALVIIGQVVNLRTMFVNASPELFDLLTFGVEGAAGILILLLVGMAMGVFAVGLFLLPMRLRSAVTLALMWTFLIGLLRDLIITIVAQWEIKAAAFPEWLGWAKTAIDAIANFFDERIFAASGLNPLSAVVIFLLIATIIYMRASRKPDSEKRQLSSPKQKRRRILTFSGVGILVLILPFVLGIYFAEILDNVGLFILMGLGLNIVVGFAGLLDLGYVAFYAIGAYTMGVLTSPELGFFNLTFWQALPFALLFSVLAGVILGLPVLKMRGDYLAIVTLGFGEIVRLLALSDWLSPWLGGTQGIQLIAQPTIGNFVFNTQAELYYLFLIGIAIVAFVSWRLKDSRLGRSWMALREDEDVAVAMGIDHVNTKLLAFATGALFSGLAGTIFAAKLQSVYPHSMNFLVSINVLSLIIIGGMGSIPGVFVGALVLIAAPEILREFAEFRFLAFGALMVAMMLLRPEGLWPEKRRKLELHEAETPSDIIDEESMPGLEPDAAS